MLISTAILAAAWFGAIPVATSVIVRDICEEKIFSGVLAWIDLRYRGTLLAYLVRCPSCLSHWVTFIWALLFWPLWAGLPLSPYLQILTAVACTFTGIRIAKFWLKP